MCNHGLVLLAFGFLGFWCVVDEMDGQMVVVVKAAGFLGLF